MKLFDQENGLFVKNPYTFSVAYNDNVMNYFERLDLLTSADSRFLGGIAFNAIIVIIRKDLQMRNHAAGVTDVVREDA